MKPVDLQSYTVMRTDILRFYHKTGLLLSLAILSLMAPVATRTVHGTGGTLYVSPSPILQQQPNTTFTVQIKVSGLTSFTGWDISVESDPLIIKPISLGITGNLFAANYSKTPTVLTSCINGSSTILGGTCEPADGPGVVTSTVFTLGTLPASPPADGLLFAITYNVTGTGTFSPIHIINDQLSDGANSVSHFTVDGAYGSGPGFNVGADPTSLVIRRGLNGTSTFTISSINGFAGSVSLAASGGLVAVFGQAALTVSAGGTKSTSLTFETSNLTAAIDYPMLITGSSGGLSVSTLVDVVVNTLPYFIISSSPSLLVLHQGTSGSSLVTVQSEVGFSGNVNLTIATPHGVSTNINTTTLTVTAEHQAEAALLVSVPLSQLAFNYLINVTATSGSLSVVSQIIVRPPTPTFSTDIGSGSINIEAGQSANATIVISSVDYLFGFVYISAQMGGGAASLSTGRLFLLPSGMANSTITVAVGADTVPGHYILLLTIYQIGGLTRSVPVTIIVTGVLHSRSLTSTNLILGLSPPVYFGLLAVLAVILAGLIVQTYRKSREE
ncbi:MAG TPA: hypothetical protein VNA15_01670 [Candidatus Angelobacter sp.]|nr:hypothetical protein [Candidatus Angelobacter sp.]